MEDSKDLEIGPDETGLHYVIDMRGVIPCPGVNHDAPLGLLCMILMFRVKPPLLLLELVLSGQCFIENWVKI